MADTTHPSDDPIGTVRVHPDDDPAKPDARRRIKLPIAHEPGWYWRSLTPEMTLPGPVASDQVMESWPAQDLKDVAVALGHSTSGPGGLRERVAERFRDLWNYRDTNSACWEAADRAITMLAPELAAKDTEHRADLDRIATAMHVKPGCEVDILVRWGENQVECIRKLVRERDALREELAEAEPCGHREPVEPQAIELDLSQIPEHLRLSDVQRTFRAAGMRLRFEVDEQTPAEQADDMFVLEANESIQELDAQLAEARAENERLTRMVDWLARVRGAAGHNSYSDGVCECGERFDDMVAWQWHRFNGLT